NRSSLVPLLLVAVVSDYDNFAEPCRSLQYPLNLLGGGYRSQAASLCSPVWGVFVIRLVGFHSVWHYLDSPRTCVRSPLFARTNSRIVPTLESTSPNFVSTLAMRCPCSSTVFPIWSLTPIA